MSYYFIARIKINNEAGYQNYIDKSEEVFKHYKGEYLSIDDSPLVLEGNWNYTRTVLIRFKNMNDFNAWYYSTDYQKILKHRLNAADCDTILLKGLD
jgi:uncharacterized protein (DUF1330 family)